VPQNLKKVVLSAWKKLTESSFINKKEFSQEEEGAKLLTLYKRHYL